MQTVTYNQKAYEVAGTTDEVTGCSCCGRQGLKMTVVLRPADAGDFVFFGSQCAARALGWGVKNANAAAKQANKERRQAVRDAQRNHPLRQAIEREWNDPAVLKMRFTERRDAGLIDRWNTMTDQIDRDVAEQFGITLEQLRSGKY